MPDGIIQWVNTIYTREKQGQDFLIPELQEGAI
jgi:hypothetical protein